MVISSKEKYPSLNAENVEVFSKIGNKLLELLLCLGIAIIFLQHDDVESFIHHVAVLVIHIVMILFRTYNFHVILFLSPFLEVEDGSPW